ncbi:hypothetical protein KVP40.0091 [Vibrio phage KVP40]|uniref:Uncharacterized protein n=2 Tax=Schizotequatrovirus KVP40 TaxID=1914019 RepID=Q6WI61_BPKVM|nr:hypothetical protein KVP40.0091 [Vibrio phage KVP40]QIW90943.1 hypothetical protein COHAPHLL_00080 [Vibrio phage V09]UNA01992.1 hypothetical protein [Vibrio phage PC-Liy1]URQ03289.1 hypothetical protein PVA8_303 [Vibrio phage PVA8]WBM59024.1 hypothetical protein vBValMPVA8_302 [Vibrio phage vB_ValM_PVA8]WOL25002.1 hypothetical protein [Vibrio phage PG216]
MTEVLITIAAIAFVALVVTLIVRARTKQKEEAANALSMREAAANRTREQLESISAMSNGASRMKPKAPSRPASSSRHSAPSRSRTRRDDDDIITNPLHPLNPITDPVGLYERDEPVRETRSEPSYSAPEPSYSEPERSPSVSSPGSYSFGGSSDSGSSYSSSSDSGSSYSSSDSSSGGSFD